VAHFVGFDRILPPGIKHISLRSGNEWVIPFPEVEQAVKLASENLIAILGVECFRILPDGGLGTETYSGYEFSLVDDWQALVRLNNQAALQFIKDNVFKRGYGYILTTTSREEFNHLGAGL
jgi:hypothetical protein